MPKAKRKLECSMDATPSVRRKRRRLNNQRFSPGDLVNRFNNRGLAPVVSDDDSDTASTDQETFESLLKDPPKPKRSGNILALQGGTGSRGLFERPTELDCDIDEGAKKILARKVRLLERGFAPMPGRGFGKEGGYSYNPELARQILANYEKQGWLDDLPKIEERDIPWAVAAKPGFVAPVRKKMVSMEQILGSVDESEATSDDLFGKVTRSEKPFSPSSFLIPESPKAGLEATSDLSGEVASSEKSFSPSLFLNPESPDNNEGNAGIISQISSSTFWSSFAVCDVSRLATDPQDPLSNDF